MDDGKGYEAMDGRAGRWTRKTAEGISERSRNAKVRTLQARIYKDGRAPSAVYAVSLGLPYCGLCVSYLFIAIGVSECD